MTAHPGPGAQTDAPPLTVRLAAPRGFCAGVSRAIEIVEKTLEAHGPPVYVRHEIVHNVHVVERLKAKGVVFIDELEEAPADRPVVFSAHGVPKRVPAEALARNLTFIDATCPLVTKVHREAERHAAAGRHMFLIGHAGHPEVEGTMGQTAPGTMTLIETLEDARAAVAPEGAQTAYVTQTTLSVTDTADIIAALKARFPGIDEPAKADICYATTNRQEAVSALAPGCDLVLVIGSETSSNSKRLVETALKAGARAGLLIDDVRALDWSALEGVRTLGVTAGASAPEHLVEELIAALGLRYTLTIEEVRTARENVVFRAPPIPTAAE